MSKSNTYAASGGDRTNFYDDITNKIIAELEVGRFPWVQPWGTTSAKAQLAMPKNASTNRTYSGINVLILWGEVIEKGYSSQSWMTFRQTAALGGHVRKGERGTTVVYADRFVPDDAKRRAAQSGGEARAIPFLKRFTVFNTHQMDDLPDEIATATRRSPDQRDRDRLPHRGKPRLLQSLTGLRAGAATGRLLRTDQLAQNGAA
jgi:antirestriction protein ArdC